MDHLAHRNARYVETPVMSRDGDVRLSLVSIKHWSPTPTDTGLVRSLYGRRPETHTQGRRDNLMKGVVGGEEAFRDSGQKITSPRI